MNVYTKRGISPVIATVLLIAIALTLAVIIFMWARSFVSEAIQKNGQAIETVCQDVGFDAEYSQGRVSVVNNKNIPLYGVEVSKVSAGSKTNIGTFIQAIGSGETASIDIGEAKNLLQDGDRVSVTPIILGEEGEYKKAFVCEENVVEGTVEAVLA